MVCMSDEFASLRIRAESEERKRYRETVSIAVAGLSTIHSKLSNAEIATKACEIAEDVETLLKEKLKKISRGEEQSFYRDLVNRSVMGLCSSKGSEYVAISACSIADAVMLELFKKKIAF